MQYVKCDRCLDEAEMVAGLMPVDWSWSRNNPGIFDKKGIKKDLCPACFQLYDQLQQALKDKTDITLNEWLKTKRSK